jgi:hypothetical protein
LRREAKSQLDLVRIGQGRCRAPAQNYLMRAKSAGSGEGPAPGSLSARPARTHTNQTSRPQQQAPEAATDTATATATESATATQPSADTAASHRETKRSKHANASPPQASAAVHRLHAQTSGRQLEPLQIKAGAEEFLAARSQESARFGEDRTRAMSRASAEPPHACE